MKPQKGKTWKDLERFSELRRGRRAQLNIKKLETTNGVAKVMWFGDLHLGHSTCLLDQAIENLEYCLNNNVYLMIMGDKLNCHLR